MTKIQPLYEVRTQQGMLLSNCYEYFKNDSDECNLQSKKFTVGSGGMPFSVRRVAQASFLLEMF